MVRRSSAVPHTLPVCPWWTLGGSALVAAVTVTLATGPERGARVSAQEAPQRATDGAPKGASEGAPPAHLFESSEGAPAHEARHADESLDGPSAPFEPVGGPYAEASLSASAGE